MRYRMLGQTGLFVSELSLGTNTFGGQGDRWKAFGALDQKQASEVLGTALEAGINLIDTADSYGDGESEARIGQGLIDIGARRESVLIATKVCLRTGPGPNS